MKKIAALLVILSLLTMTYGCGDTKVINGIEYDTYGLFNSEEQQNPDIKYRIIIGNVVWSIILVETIVAPIYFIGFSMYEPVREKGPNEPKGSI